eukprot:scaffold1156_cov131-Isochrysis_galbana.AAC.7
MARTVGRAHRCAGDDTVLNIFGKPVSCIAKPPRPCLSTLILESDFAATAALRLPCRFHRSQ